MPRKSPTKAIILGRLSIGSATLSELFELCRVSNISKSSVRSTISRLRSAGWHISSENTFRSGDPRYTLISDPESIAPGYTCRGCGRYIGGGAGHHHAEDCRFLQLDERARQTPQIVV